MRKKAHAAILRTLVCALFCSSPLIAKPARAAAHESSRHQLVPMPASREAFHGRATHHLTNAVFVSHGAPSRTVRWTRATLRASTSRATRAAVLDRVEVHARGSHASTDSATLDRVHAWELTHRNPPRTTPAADDSRASLDVPGSSDLADDAGSSSNLLRTTPELPRIKSIEEEASTPLILPSLYNQRGRLVVPTPLYGSHEVLLHQNQMADRDGLGRVQDDADLLDLRRDKKLVELPLSETLRVDDRLPANRRYSRPWTADFLVVLARDHFNRFHIPLQVNSAVRTVEFQRHLLRTNGNAAPAGGDTASPHLTGQAIDIAKRGLTLPEIAWMRAYLQPLIEQGKIDVEEEFQQSCFHISVYRNFLPPLPTHITVASTRQTHADSY